MEVVGKALSSLNLLPSQSKEAAVPRLWSAGLWKVLTAAPARGSWPVSCRPALLLGGTRAVSLPSLSPCCSHCPSWLWESQVAAKSQPPCGCRAGSVDGWASQR